MNDPNSINLAELTSDDYRTMFGLPRDYPMVAPAYTKQRSSLAKSLGLGKKAKVTKTATGP